MLSVSEIQQLCHRYSLPIQSDMAVEGYPWPVGHGGPGYHKPDQQIGPFGASRGRKADVAETTVAVTDAPLGAYPVAPTQQGGAGVPLESDLEADEALRGGAAIDELELGLGLGVAGLLDGELPAPDGALTPACHRRADWRLTVPVTPVRRRSRGAPNIFDKNRGRGPWPNRCVRSKDWQMNEETGQDLFGSSSDARKRHCTRRPRRKALNTRHSLSQ